MICFLRLLVNFFLSQWGTFSFQCLASNSSAAGCSSLHHQHFVIACFWLFSHFLLSLLILLICCDIYLLASTLQQVKSFANTCKKRALFSSAVVFLLFNYQQELLHFRNREASFLSWNASSASKPSVDFFN